MTRTEMTIRLTFLTLYTFLQVCYTCDTIRYSNKLLMIVDGKDTQAVNDLVGGYGIYYTRHVMGKIHEYKMTDAPEMSEQPLQEQIVQEIISKAPETILNIYQMEEASMLLDQNLSRQRFLRLALKRKESVQTQCTTCYGMHIMDTWSLGYQGEGITVAIVDTGIEIKHVDLEPNIDLSLSRNFVQGQEPDNVNPDDIGFYIELEDESDHGNNCAGLVAAVRDNDICGAGVAPKSTLVALKVIKVKEPDPFNRVLQFNVTSLIDALAYSLKDIDVYSLNIGPSQDFTNSSQAVHEAFRAGIEQGRHGKGSIFVCAGGNKGKTKKNLNLDGYVNSIYTIAINSVGVNGSIPEYAQPGAVILASAYGDGQNNFVNYMKTTSHRNSCRNDFRGTSAAGSIASGIIALVLQANPNLTWRDVQHLIVITSTHDSLERPDLITINSAGLSYHPFFGFGLMDAKSLVESAKNWSGVLPQITTRASAADRSGDGTIAHRMMVEINTERTPNFTEHVVADIEYSSYYDHLVILKLCSPSNTCSDLLTEQYNLTQQVVKRVKRQWKFMSVQFWGENPQGIWQLNISVQRDDTSQRERKFALHKFSLTVYGHSSNGTVEGVIRDTKPDKETSDNSPLIFLAKLAIFLIIGACIIRILQRLREPD